MAKSFIHYDVKNGIEYASVYTPRRKMGRKVNDPVMLGHKSIWVIDITTAMAWSKIMKKPHTGMC